MGEPAQKIPSTLPKLKRKTLTIVLLDKRFHESLFVNCHIGIGVGHRIPLFLSSDWA